MSYILDALRKADAQRERDPGRGIHAQPQAGRADSTSRRVPPWAWLASAVVVALAAAAVLWPRESPVVAARMGAPEAAPPAPAPVRMPAAPPPAIAAAPAPQVADTVIPPAPPLPVPTRERPATRPPATAAPVPVAAAPAQSAAPAAATAAAMPAAPAAPAADRVWTVAELPADVQRELPKLAISGGVYSENAAQRMLIVGGQVVNEGAEVAPGVVLEQIRARTAVLRFRGYRYSVGF